MQKSLEDKVEESNCNAHLKNQLSLTQQKLLGVQPVMTCSRLWVVSHDQFTIGREVGAWATVHEAILLRSCSCCTNLYKFITACMLLAPNNFLRERCMDMTPQCQHQNTVTLLVASLRDPPVILMELFKECL